MRALLLFLAAGAIASGDTVINGDRTILGGWDASNASKVKPAKTGTLLPTSCEAGEVYFKTDAAAGKNLYLCNPVNTWTQTSGAAASITTTFGVSLDGGGTAIQAGHKGYVTIPYACTITGWSVQADQSGNLQIEIDKKAGAIPAVTADKITATDPPSLNSAQLRIVNCDSGCTGWSRSVMPGDVIGYYVSSASVVTRATLVVNCAR